MTKRIGFFAGSFDPIHDGHLEVARSAVQSLDLAELNFMVEQNPWSLKIPANIKHRIAMVDLAIKDENRIKQLILNEPQFDIKTTLHQIENKYGGNELYFIFGADVFLNMSSGTWPDLKKILSHYIVVFERGEVDESRISEHAKSLGIVTAIISSKHNNHCSTDIRMQPHKSKIWVPSEVASYIKSNGLYSNNLL